MTNKKKRGFTIWITGLPCSGKTTISRMIAEELQKRGIKVEGLDGEQIRQELDMDLGFNKGDRDKQVRRIGFICHLLSRNEIVAVASLVSPYRETREEIRQKIGSFIEVYAKCPIQICMQRDKQGLFQMALEGKIKNLTGISDPYEEPLSPDVIIETDQETPQEGVIKILNALQEKGYISKANKGVEEYQEKEEIFSVEEEEKIKKRLEDLGYI